MEFPVHCYNCTYMIKTTALNRPSTFENLEMILMCNDWEDLYPLTVSALDGIFSNHVPLLLDYGARLKKS